MRPQTLSLRGRELECKIFGKSRRIPANLLVQALRRDAEHARKVEVENDLAVPDPMNRNSGRFEGMSHRSATIEAANWFRSTFFDERMDF